jgi:hypothetical protein
VTYQIPDQTPRRKRKKIFMSYKTLAEIEAIDSGGHTQKLLLHGLIVLHDMETRQIRRSIWEACIILFPDLLSETRSRRAGGLQQD